MLGPQHGHHMLVVDAPACGLLAELCCFASGPVLMQAYGQTFWCATVA